MAHRCCECSGEIVRGDLYEYTSGVWDAPAAFKTCLPCAEQRAELITEIWASKWWGACVALGELREVWFEFHDVRPLPRGAAEIEAALKTETDDAT